MEEKVQAALIAAAAAILVSGLTGWLDRLRMKREFRLEFQAEGVARSLLLHPKWRLRTFKTIKYHLSGFGDDDLRQILIRAGAVRFEDRDGIEIWGLLSRNQDLLEKEHGTSDN